MNPPAAHPSWNNLAEFVVLFVCGKHNNKKEDESALHQFKNP
jgi:hypothetical protein